MYKRELPCAAPGGSLDLAALAYWAEGWYLDLDSRNKSDDSIALRRIVLGKLRWFLTSRGLDACGQRELQQFLSYLRHGHADPGGRWGNKRLTRPPRPETVRTYHRLLKAFFAFVVRQEGLEGSPMARVGPVDGPSDQVQPFSDGDVLKLLEAARRTTHPRRDEAICLLLLDTGLRAAELCELTTARLDLQRQRATLQGKFEKERTVHFGKTVARALWAYLREEPREADGPVFLADRGRDSGSPLTPSGLLQLMKRLQEASGITGVRCSPHTWRHTFAVNFLRNGGNVFTLKEKLGHSTLAMTNRYVAIAQADLERQQWLYSPADILHRNRGRGAR